MKFDDSVLFGLDLDSIPLGAVDIIDSTDIFGSEGLNGLHPIKIGRWV